ncbi:MAG: LytR C-terminal domain-containing protein [Gemmatimonadaceae bacterium]|nr:LytR C-terminal domain-containing protein [Gemmatimonadaceae bacterium]
MALALGVLLFRGGGLTPPGRVSVLVPDDVRVTVEVLNASGIRGLARRATFALRDAGFDVVRFANDTGRRDSTLVLSRSGKDDWAHLVAKALGGARVEARPDSSRYLDVTVLLGADWRPPTKPFRP